MSIFSAAKAVKKITDVELDATESMAREQMAYTHPLKLATQARQSALGHYNVECVRKMRELRDLLLRGPQK